MAGNTVSLEFAGDATKLQQAAKKADAALTEVGDSAKKTGQDAGDGGFGDEALPARRDEAQMHGRPQAEIGRAHV